MGEITKCTVELVTTGGGPQDHTGQAIFGGTVVGVMICIVLMIVAFQYYEHRDNERDRKLRNLEIENLEFRRMAKARGEL